MSCHDIGMLRFGCQSIVTLICGYQNSNVNPFLFEVARAVGLGEGEGGQGLMGAVAGADIFLMALYFAALVRWGRDGRCLCLSVTGAANVSTPHIYIYTI